MDCDSWPQASVADLRSAGVLLVEDGNHGEYRPRPDEFTAVGTSFIRAADMSDGRVLFESASRIDDTARARIRKGVGAPGDVLLSHKGTVGKVAFASLHCEPFVCSPQTTFWRSLDQSRLDRRYPSTTSARQVFRTNSVRVRQRATWHPMSASRCNARSP